MPDVQGAQEGEVLMAESRCWDGKPETEAERKFFDLRESGYTGPIDQDGNPASPNWPNH